MRLPTLKSRAEFARIRDGSKWTARSFILQGKPRAGAGTDAALGPVTAPVARFGFAVSGRALAEKGQGRVGAVVRNRARRRLKEALRQVAPVAAKPGYDYVIIGRREALHQPFADLLEDMRLAFEKVHRPRVSADGQPRLGRRRDAAGAHRQTAAQPHPGRSAGTDGET